jgi:hypothetical protein
LDAWLDSVALAVVVIAIGAVALGSRIEPWRPHAVTTPVEEHCVALHAGPLDHQPKCATSTGRLADDADRAPATPVQG